jgi:cell division septation protein DedD
MALDGGGRRGSDEFSDDDIPARRSGRMLPLAIALVALGGFGAIVWYAYSWGVGQVPNQELPVVRAPEGPIKDRPENPGGMEVPYQDKLVLNGDIDGSGETAVERLLPPPEVPQRPEPAPESAPESTPEQVAEPAAEQMAEPPRLSVDENVFTESAEPAPVATPAQAEAPVAVEPAKPEAQPETLKAEVKVEPQPVAKPAPAPAPAPTSAPTSTEATGGGYVMQMAALRSEPDALKAWKQIQGKHVALLEGLKPLIERADLGDRGVFYRLQTGPFPSKATADDLCAQLKATGQDCLVTKR